MYRPIHIEKESCVNEGIKQKFLDYFDLEPPVHTQRVIEKMAREGTSTPDDDSWVMLNYLLDNLHLADKKLAAGLKTCINNPTGKKNIYIRIDGATAKIDSGNSDISEEEWQPFSAALDAIKTPFRRDIGINELWARREGMSRDQFVLESVKYFRAVAETFERLQDPNQTELIAEQVSQHLSRKQLQDNKQEEVQQESSQAPQPSVLFPDLILDEEELLETMRVQGFLQCDLNR